MSGQPDRVQEGGVTDFYPPEIALPQGVELPPVVPKLKKKSKRDSFSVEYDIRAATVALLLASGIERRLIRIEIPLDTASSAGRADIVIPRPKMLYCVELKSGKDKFDEEALREQTRHYRRVFDAVAIVADKVHFKEWEQESGSYKYKRHNWNRVNAAYCHDTKAFLNDFEHKKGREAMGYERIVPIRHADRIFDYPAPSSATAPRDMLHILWADEVKRLTGYKQKSIFIRHAREELCLREARELVVKALSERPLNKWEEKFWERYDQKLAA